METELTQKLRMLSDEVSGLRIWLNAEKQALWPRIVMDGRELRNAVFASRAHLKALQRRTVRLMVDIGENCQLLLAACGLYDLSRADADSVISACACLFSMREAP